MPGYITMTDYLRQWRNRFPAPEQRGRVWKSLLPIAILFCALCAFVANRPIPNHPGRDRPLLCVPCALLRNSVVSIIWEGHRGTASVIPAKAGIQAHSREV